MDFLLREHLESYSLICGSDIADSSMNDISMKADEIHTPGMNEETPAYWSESQELSALFCQCDQILYSQSYQWMPSSRIIFLVHQPMHG